ncbi:MAG: hypothetical protein ACLFQ8_01145 [Candidatus Aenigmatarchaeota archaeon]
MRICPSCGSEKIRTDRGNFLALIGMDRGYACTECGYKGSFFLDIEEEKLEEAKEFLQERDTEEFKEKMMNAELGFNKGKIVFGLAFFLMGIPLILFMPLGLNFFIGVLSIFIGLALIHGEAKKLNS